VSVDARRHSSDDVIATLLSTAACCCCCYDVGSGRAQREQRGRRSESCRGTSGESASSEQIAEKMKQFNTGLSRKRPSNCVHGDHSTQKAADLLVNTTSENNVSHDSRVKRKKSPNVTST